MYRIYLSYILSIFVAHVSEVYHAAGPARRRRTLPISQERINDFDTRQEAAPEFSYPVPSRLR